MASARSLDPNGYMTVRQTPISGAGVFPYLGRNIPGAADPDKVYNVFRPPEAWEDPEALDSVRHVPLIYDHDMIGGEGTGYMAPEDKGIHGITCDNVTFDGKTLFADLKVYSQRLLGMIKSGRRALSLGMKCRFEPASGVYDGKEYQWRQVNLRVNHIASVIEPRVPNAMILDNSLVYDHFDISLDTQEQEDMADEDKKKDEDKAMDSATLKAALDAALAPLTAKIAAMDEKLCAMDEDKDDDKKSKAEDDMEDDETAEDEDDKDKDDKKDSKAMDAAEITRLVAAGTEKAYQAAIREQAAKTDLANRLSAHVGVFDHAEKTLAQVAAYGREKLGLRAGLDDLSSVEGYLAAKPAPSPAAAFALDASVGDKAKSDVNSYFKRK